MLNDLAPTHVYLAKGATLARFNFLQSQSCNLDLQLCPFLFSIKRAPASLQIAYLITLKSLFFLLGPFCENYFLNRERFYKLLAGLGCTIKPLFSFFEFFFVFTVLSFFLILCHISQKLATLYLVFSSQAV